ncbi:MAG: ABC transporter ATP-binding protein, partial [Oscillospiraceae bacterium]|nr:ABC transporter ATP-binding protein [Oscillospiraceae bacterium]
MFKLFKYFKGYTLQAVSAPLFKIIEAIFELMLPFVVASVIDKGIPLGQQGDYSHIIKMCLVMVLLAAVGLASTLTAQYFSAKAAVGLTTNIRRALFSHIQGLGFSELDKLGTSTLITRITNDLNQVQTGVNWVLRLLMRSPVIVFGAAIMAFSIDTKSALVFVVIIPLLSLVVFGVMLATIPLHTAVQRRLDKVLLKTKENLVGARVIRAFCKEEGETKEFLEENGALAKAQKVVGRISSITNPLTFIIINFGIIALIYTGALRVESGILTQGMIIALYNYMSQILIELVKLANLIVSTTKAVACGNRIQSVFEINPSLQNGNATNGNDTETAVEFKDVSFAYQGSGENSLENISFALKKGEKLGVIGSTGCGKTTLANLIPRFYDATKGEVLVDGVNVKNYDFEALRHKIGFVMQKNRLFKGSLRENIAWGKLDATDSEILEALKLAQG